MGFHVSLGECIEHVFDYRSKETTVPGFTFYWCRAGLGFRGERSM